VFGYCRVSTDRQADGGIGLEEQQRKIAARCLENDWQLAEVFVDAGVSGSTPIGKRPEGDRLLRNLRPGDIVIAAKMDRCFRSALDALQTIADFRRRKISFWLLDLGGDVSGNGIAELMMTILAAIAQFERGLISERIKDAKRVLRRGNRHQGGARQFGYQLGKLSDNGTSRPLIPDPAEQAAIADIVVMRASGHSLMAIRDAMRGRGFQISHQTVRNVVARQAEAEGLRHERSPYRPPRGGHA
jgi:DNA invertase Pin-like site-specific DNA recombinase